MEFSFILMDHTMKEASKNPILMVMEFYTIKIKLWCILEIGLTVSLMEKVKKYTEQMIVTHNIL